ncbi:imidazolonepropionase [Psychrobacter sanguinis]|uniref:Imidazolonepropionase n=1 Tax=Psychrobacter sanguinis TaxID=861445 RepID=A0A844LZ22_9GAMM|nr:imidazolonepropionase [Psychrobacter sanguinis]MUG31959.1 imidazolonepropionase [Psychrobacter sanguinis]
MTSSIIKDFPEDFDTLILHANIATFSEQYGFDRALAVANADPSESSKPHSPYGQIIDGALTIKEGKISWIGDSQSALNSPAYHQAIMQADADDKIIYANRQWLLPGLIDCHTHLVYGGNRSNEFEARLQGVSYKQIADNGGGIVATVTATREADFDTLYAQTERRLQALLAEGVTTIEIKSGYGLDLDTERKMLQVARQLGKDYNITVKTTYLAAHALPTEYKDKENGSDEYIEAVCEWLPILHNEGLIDAVDGFVENIGFTTEQMRKVFDVAKSLNLPVKLHAEQLSDMDGSGLVAEYNGLSSDHLEYLSEQNVQKMAEHDVVAVLLPGAFYTLKETQLPPMQALYKHNVAIALSTDCNPGTSPLTSLLMTLNMGCTLFSMTPEQALAGITTHAAKALGLDNKGRIEVGLDADLTLWDIERPADLAYQMGLNPIEEVMVGGQIVGGQWRR